MGMFSFIKNEGKILLGISDAKAADVVANADPRPVNADVANKAAADAIAGYVEKNENF
jgi:hypothetical protein